jgi:putative transposase
VGKRQAFKQGLAALPPLICMVYHSILDNMKEQHTKHVTYKIGYHFVWCPTYRKNILTGKIAHFVESEIRRLCEANHWTIGALHIQEDHVHLFVSAPPSVSPSLIANTLKGISARQVFKQFPEVKKQLWGGSFWSRSFYVGTVGEMTEETVKKYIEVGQGS